MNQYQQICKSDNWSLDGAVSKHQMKLRLIVSVSETKKCMYYAVVRQLNKVGQLAQCFEGFDQVIVYMKDPAHLEIDKSSGVITIIQKSPIRKNKSIILAQIKPDYHETIQQSGLQSLKKMKLALEKGAKDLPQIQVKSIFNALLGEVCTLLEHKTKIQKNMSFCEQQLKILRKQLSGRNKQLAKPSNIEDKGISQDTIAKLQAKIQKLQQKILKLQKVSAQNIKSIVNLRDNKLDKNEFSPKLNQTEIKITKTLDELRIDLEKKLALFEEQLKSSSKKIDFSPKKIQKQSNKKIEAKKQQKKPEEMQIEAVLKQKLTLAAKANSWQELQAKQNLDASAKSIEHLPEQICSLKNIKLLKICNNSISSLPENFGNLVSLKQVDISSNGLQQLPESFGELRELNTLWCSANKIEQLPSTFCNLVNLKLLYLYNNKLQILPENIGNLKILKTLWIYGNRLSTLPDSFGNLKCLEELEINENKFETLSDSFCNLKFLQKLYLQFNKLIKLPECFGNLKSLKNLWVYNNKLETLPESIGNMKSLQKLQAHENKLMQLPKSLGSLEQLEGLQFTIFPESSIKLESLPLQKWKNLKKLTINYQQPKEDLDSFTNKCREKNIQVQFIQK